jgi:hypothetical protein
MGLPATAKMLVCPIMEEEEPAAHRARFFFGGGCLIRAITGVDYSITDGK